MVLSIRRFLLKKRQQKPTKSQNHNSQLFAFPPFTGAAPKGCPGLPPHGTQSPGSSGHGVCRAPRDHEVPRTAPSRRRSPAARKPSPARHRRRGAAIRSRAGWRGAAECRGRSAEPWPPYNAGRTNGPDRRHRPRRPEATASLLTRPRARLGPPEPSLRLPAERRGPAR